jgi:hypothetical protein
VGVWEAVCSQAATETAEGEGRWSREGGVESVVARRQRGVSAVTPVNAGSHSSRCVRTLCCDVAMSRVWMKAGFVVEGCATPIKIGGVFLGCRGWAGSVGGPNGVCFGACAGGCATTLSTVLTLTVRSRACTNKAWQTVVCSAGDAHARDRPAVVGGGGVGGGGGGGVVLKCSRARMVDRPFGGRSSRRAASTRTRRPSMLVSGCVRCGRGRRMRGACRLARRAVAVQ